MTINKWSTRLPAAAAAPAADAVAAAFLKAHSGGWRNLISHNIMKRECSALSHSRQCWTQPGRDVELYVKCVCVFVCVCCTGCCPYLYNWQKVGQAILLHEGHTHIRT